MRQATSNIKLLIATAVIIVLADLTVTFAWDGAGLLLFVGGVLVIYTASRKTAWGVVLLLVSAVHCAGLWIVLTKWERDFFDPIGMSRVLGFYGWGIISVLVLAATIVAPRHAARGRKRRERAGDSGGTGRSEPPRLAP
jgi:hypothetical protein